jgi:hypothetical protein
LVLGRRINEVSDTSGKLTLSVWKATDVLSGVHDFQVDLADDWVCIGGGGTGREHALKGGPNFTVIVIGANYLTASFPSVDAAGEHDWKGWRIKSKDHIHPSPWELIGYAIGIKHKDLNKQELISNLKVFKGVGMAVPHPEFRTYIEMGYLLLGGGFHVVDQPPGGGNIATASFPDSTLSWRARSQDMEVPSPSRLDIFAIGIREELRKPHPTGPSIGKTITSYSSMEFLNLPPSWPGSDDPWSVAQPLPGFALCGGGGAVHPGKVGGYLYALEPTTLENPVTAADPNPLPLVLDPFSQTFTAKSTTAYEIDTNTAYAMGIKFIPAEATTPPTPPPPACDKRVQLTDASSSGNQPTYDPPLAIDNNLSTKWWSTNIQNPYLTVSLPVQTAICRVDIAWADGNTHKYKFSISIGVGSANPVNVYPVGLSTGSTTSPEPYFFVPTEATSITITITESTPGASNSIAQISEVLAFTSG